MVDDETWAAIEDAALAHRIGLISYVFYRIGDYREAEDITQEAYVVLFNKRKKVPLEKVKSYLFSCVRNLCRNYMKKKKQTVLLETEIDSIRWGDMRHVEIKHDLIKALNRLNHRQKEVVMLRLFGDFSIKEISLLLKIREGTVKSRLFHGLLAIRPMMKEHIE